ncbi:hypothetical protein [Allokutzneria oryzae]|uniref:Uncharacterized protein n=1 Tax=Allokutzneria oryzae TaxID=1378989 RepID=A0ABV5ZS27_9PSEU
MATLLHRHTAAEALHETGSVPGTHLPCLLPGITLVPTPTGLVAYGGLHPQVFGGKSASTVLPAVLRAMDGTRTTADIAERLGLPQSTVDAVCALARSRHLLGSGPSPREHSGRWLVRARATTATPENTSRAPAQQTKVRVTGDLVLAGELATLLTADGADVAVVDWAGEDFPPGTADLVVVVLAQPEPVEVLASFDRSLAAAGVPWLRVVVGAEGAEIGPRFTARDELRYASWWPVNPPRASREAALEVRQAALGFAALEVINLVTAAGSPLSTTAVAEFDAATGACRPRPRAPRPADGDSSVCLAVDYMARQSTSDTSAPKLRSLPEPDPMTVEPPACPDLARLLRAAFPDADDQHLNAYLLVPPGSGWPAGAHLYRPGQGGLLDLAGVADERAWLSQHADGAAAAIVVSVTVPRGSGAAVIRDALLDTGSAVQHLTSAARDLGFRVRDDVGGSLGELGDALGVLPHAETLLDVVVLERVPGGRR